MLQGDAARQLPNPDPIRGLGCPGVASPRPRGLRVGVDGITLSTRTRTTSTSAPLSGYEMYRIHMADLLNASPSSPAQLSAKIRSSTRTSPTTAASVDRQRQQPVPHRRSARARSASFPRTPSIYREYVMDPNLIWPDGVTYNADGATCTRAPRSSSLTGTFQANATPPRHGTRTRRR